MEGATPVAKKVELHLPEETHKLDLDNPYALSPVKQFKKVHIKGGIYHPKELYCPQRSRSQDPFRKANPFSGSKYHDMLTTLNLGCRSSLGEVLQRSAEARRSLRETLRLQADNQYLKSQRLPPLPNRRGAPLVVRSIIDKNIAKRAGNDAHGKLTNGGYSRTCYGGFFMH